jgi:hypothetical protein
MQDRDAGLSGRIDAYASCLKQEAASVQDGQAARGEFEKIRTQFNRRARGE